MRNAVFRDVLVVYSSKKGGEEPHVLLAGTRFAIAPAMTTQSDNVTNQHTLSCSHDSHEPHPQNPCQ
jgi:hypothetical protein